MLKLNIRAFFFNAQTDYLPYYKNFSFLVESNQTLFDILNMIKKKNPDFSFPAKNIILKINEFVVTADKKISTVVDKLGTELQIDPALAYRSNNGLILNDSDFMQSFKLLSEFTNDADKIYYQSLYPLHYASSSFEYNHQYIGDAVLLLASRLIQKNPENEYEILNAINDEFNGINYCEYENNILNGQDHTETINKLKAKVVVKTTTSFIDRLYNLTVKKRMYTLDAKTIGERKIALYVGNRESYKLIETTNREIKEKGATSINFPMSTRLAGQSVIERNLELAHQKAGKMLLEALDHGADTLLFEKDEDLALFSSIKSKAESVVGRPIELQLIALNMLQNLPNKVVA
jgi:succinate dehydrogenase/fumarate reductase-like Fe-S protein